MPEIGPDSIPGSVVIPTWAFVAALLFLFALRELDRRKATAELATASATVSELTGVVKQQNATLEKQAGTINDLKALVERVLDAVKRSEA